MIFVFFFRICQALKIVQNCLIRVTHQQHLIRPKKRTNKDAIDEYLEKANEVLNSKSDEHNIFGANIACKLRKMNEDQLICTEYLINEILNNEILKSFNNNC